MNTLMCLNEKRAKLNRERTATKFDLPYYLRQERAVAQWAEGGQKPKGVRLGVLPELLKPTKVPKQELEDEENLTGG